MKHSILAFSILLAAIWLSCEKKMSCTDFKTGTFLIANDSTFANAQKVIRTENLQQQISPKGDTLFAKVKWLNDCSYILTFDKSKMHLNSFQINVNSKGGILVEYGQPTGNVMPYLAVIKGKTKTQTIPGYIKKIN